MDAMFAGSFDPFTIGHFDIVSRARDYFDTVHICIVAEHSKDALLDIESRKDIIKSYFTNTRGIYVDIIYGTVAQYAYNNNITVNIRGIRNSDKLSYELELFENNYSINNQLDTFFLPCRKEYSNISSSMCRRVLKQHGDVSSYVNTYTKKACELLVNNRLLVMVDSESTKYSSELCKSLSEEFLDVKHISINEIIDDICASSDPYALLLKDKLRRLIDNKIVTGMKVDIGRLFTIINNTNQREVILELFKEPIKHLLSSKIRDLDLDKNINSIILIENSKLNANNLRKLTSNNIIYVSYDKEEINMDLEFLKTYVNRDGNGNVIHTDTSYDVSDIYTSIITRMI
jgi:pantetheine-phosphate adenylyltransferase